MSQQRPQAPHIEVMDKVTAQRSGRADLAFTYDCDQGPLAMPKEFKLGAPATRVGGNHSSTIDSYADKVCEYQIWLEQKLRDQDEHVMNELDHIFGKALAQGVILVTGCMPSPWHTHAHEIRNVILKLASDLEPEEKEDELG